MAMPGDDRSVSTLLSDLVGQLTTLVRKEIQLARTEVSEKVDTVVSSLGLIIGGAVLSIAALVIVLHAAAQWLIAFDVADQWAYTAVGLGTVVVGALLLRSGLANLKAKNLTPTRTIDQLQRDASVVKEQVR